VPKVVVAFFPALTDWINAPFARSIFPANTADAAIFCRSYWRFGTVILYKKLFHPGAITPDGNCGSQFATSWITL
jgi:hypothetical protein